MEQLVIGRELPNLKITLAGLEAPATNSNVETDVMEVDDEHDNKTNEEESRPKVKVDVKLEFMSYKGMKRYENKQGSLVTGLDLTSEELQEKLEKRAKRFQIESRQKSKITQEEIEALYKSLNITIGGDKSPEKNRGIRLDAIHIRGVSDMSTDDIFAYFAEYGPSSIEWINDVSCNVVWLDKASAARALLGLSRPLILHRRKKSIAEDSDTKHYNQEGEDEEKYIEGEEVVMMSEDESSDEDEDMPVENLQNPDSNVNSTFINNSEENAAVPTVAAATSADNSASSLVTTVQQEAVATEEETVATLDASNAQDNSSASKEDPVALQGCISSQDDNIAQNDCSTHKTAVVVQEDSTIPKNNLTSSKENYISASVQKDPITITPPESPVNTNTSLVKDAELEEKVDEELPLSVPPGYWRLGVPHPKAKVLLLRFATKDDKKIRGAEKRSVYYKKYGNPNYGGMKGLISNSRKRRFWQLQQKRELQQLGIKNNEISRMDIQNDVRRMESSSSESENDDIMKPLRRKLRMKMYADEEENKQKRKRLNQLRFNRNDRRMVMRKKLMKSVMIGNTQNEDSDSCLDDKNDMASNNLQHSGATVWGRLTNLDENTSSDFEETSDLRNKLQYRGSNIGEWTQQSMSPITGDLRGKLDRIRNKQYIREHRSPLLIHVANEQSD